MTRPTLVSLALAVAAFVAFAASVPANAAQQVPTLYAIGDAVLLEYSQSGSDLLPSDALGGSSGLDLPHGVATDSHGNFWVTSAGLHRSDNAIFAFAPGTKHPFFKIPNTYAILPTFSPDGTLAAAIAVGNTFEIAIYPTGATTPSRLIPFPYFYVEGIALDANDDVYVSGFTGPNRRGIVKVLRDGHLQGLGIKLVSPGSIVIRPDGSLVAIDLERRTLETFAPGATTPSHVITVPGLFIDNGSFAFDSTGKNVYVAAGGGFCCGPTAIFEFDYATGRIVKTITAGFTSAYTPSSLATSP